MGETKIIRFILNICICRNKCSKCGWVASSIKHLETHRLDVHGEKVHCGVCVEFVFPKSYWCLYRQHHRDHHPEQDFVGPLPFNTKPKSNLEDWEIPPEDVFFEVGSHVSEDNLSYSCISSDPLATDNDTTPEVKLQDELYSPISSDASSSTSDWETVPELDLSSDVVPLREVSVPVMPWRLIPVDVPPRGLFRGEKKKMGMDPRMEKYSAFFERL